MICPYCGEPLDRYETYTGYCDEDGDTIETEEHYACYNCDRTFSRMVTYKAIKKGMLEE